MSAQIIQLDTHRVMLGRFVPTPIPALNTVRGYCELLSLSAEQTGLCIAVAMQRLSNGGHPMNAIAAGKDRADRMFRASYREPTPPKDAA